MSDNLYISVPTWSPSKQWHYTNFSTRDEFRDYVKSLFKEPGLYAFDETSAKFNEHATYFLAKEKVLGKDRGIYCEFQKRSKQFQEYWDSEKEKCRKGVIYLNDKGDSWYLPRFYYHWLNFLQIYNKEKKAFQFPDFRDVQYHMCLYEALAELFDKNSATLKRRQVASSYVQIAKIFNKYIFEEGYVGKIGASDKKFIEGVNGCWRYLNHYKNFTNSKTAWIRQNDPDKVYSWQQRVKTTEDKGDGKVDIYKGTHAIISGITFEKDPIAGVGGATDNFFYEEGGVAPTANITYGYLRDALKEGAVKTGVFSIAGSVGDLKQCEPLKEFITNPTANEIYSVMSTLADDTGQLSETGMFIPVFWGYYPYIDQYGNSLVDAAKAAVDQEYKDCRYGNEAKGIKPMAPHDYQLKISQGPRNIAEAFATRTESMFPLRYTAAQVKRIEDKEYYVKYVDLEREGDHIIDKPSQRQPIEYNSSASAIMKMADKRGCGEMRERPVDGTHESATGSIYVGAIDPVDTGTTTSSASLACIVIYKLPVEVVKTVDGEKTIHLEGDYVVYKHWFRYDDIDDTNEVLSTACEFYNARVMCENNKDSFIQYMRYKKRQKYLAGSKEMVFDKDIEDKQTHGREFGVYMTDKLWSKLLDYAINFLSQKLGTIKRAEGDEKKEKIVYGVERIGPFIGIIREMQAYNEKGNFDQVKCFGILIGFIRSQEATRGGVPQRVERTQAELDKAKELYELLKHRDMFNNMGRNRSYNKVKRSDFRNMH